MKLTSLVVVVISMMIMSDGPLLHGQTARRPNRPTRITAPEWYVKVPADDSSLVGRGRADSKDQQVAVDKAATAARSGLAAIVERRWKELLMAIQKEGAGPPAWTGESVTLEGSTITMQKTYKRGRVWTAFVLVCLPKSSVQSVLVQRLRRDADWYSMVKDTKAVRAFEDLSPQ
jgi:hypothetical protein